jgi:hypothetical protein
MASYHTLKRYLLSSDVVTEEIYETMDHLKLLLQKSVVDKMVQPKIFQVFHDSVIRSSQVLLVVRKVKFCTKYSLFYDFFICLSCTCLHEKWLLITYCVGFDPLFTSTIIARPYFCDSGETPMYRRFQYNVDTT